MKGVVGEKNSAEKKKLCSSKPANQNGKQKERKREKEKDRKEGMRERKVGGERKE